MKLSVKKIGFLSLCFGLLAGPLAHAEVLTIQSVTGASLYVPGTASTGGSAATTPTIFAGIVADTGGVMTGECAAPPSNEATCNSCDGTGLKPCNPTSIHGNLNLRIRLKSDSDIFTNSPSLRYSVGDTNMHIPTGTPPTLRRSEAFDFVLDWNTLCSKYAGGTNQGSCLNDMTSVTLTVGIINGAESTYKEKVDIVVNLRYIDNTATTYDAYSACPDGVAPTSGTQGICDFTVFPGDEKIYILSFYSSSTTLATPHSAIKYNRMVMFYAPTLGAVNNLSTNYTLNLTVNSTTGSTDEEPSLDSNKITGLQNDVQRYCFALGNQDQAGNISYFTPASELLDGNTAKERKYCATPSDVVGLLDDKKCFIATATFGSEMAPEVNTFRAFRNQFLMTNSVGRSFVKAYYKFGPMAAQWISDSPFLKSLSLMALWPLLLFVKISLALGLMPALLVSLLTSVLLMRSAQMILRRRSTAGEA